MAQSDQLKPFRDGLYRVLLAGDVSAFGRYLRQWEDLIGDTADLAETSEAQQRRTMESLLRRPQQFNLPPWPREVTAPPGEGGWEPDKPQESDRLPPALEASPVRAGSMEAEAPAHETTEASEAGRVYQVDMMTGELVPVESAAARFVHQLVDTVQQVDTSQPSRSESVTRSRRPRRRHLPAGMTQLTMWDDGEPVG